MDNETDDNSERRMLGEALRRLRKRAHLSQVDAGERAGMSGEGWRKYEAGQAPTIFRPDVQRRLVTAIGANAHDLTRERDLVAAGVGGVSVTPKASTIPPAHRQPDPGMLPIAGRVQAGAWLLSDDHAQDPPRTYPAVRDPRFPHAQQWLDEVSGDSVNLLHIFEGDLVHCVDAVAIGYAPRDGDLVEVERLRFDGSERELTLKQIEVTTDGVLLWPRSSNPRWQRPLELRAGVGEHEEIEVRIRGLVLASIRRF